LKNGASNIQNLRYKHKHACPCPSIIQKWFQKLHCSLRYEPIWSLKNSKVTLLFFFPLVNIFEESIGGIFPWCSSNTSRPSKRRLVIRNFLHQILWSLLQFWAVNMQQKI
jgi:hypothetical protein